MRLKQLKKLKNIRKHLSFAEEVEEIKVSEEKQNFLQLSIENLKVKTKN
jgi:hypothetical protein